ncbi:hypothetical protein [Pseudoalteromonas aurantia]|nr:hypothetical protein [Pseudoalteromonas aurantia]
MTKRTDRSCTASAVLMTEQGYYVSKAGSLGLTDKLLCNSKFKFEAE